MFPNNQQNKKPQSTNTRGRRITNDEGLSPSLIDMGYWDGFSTFRIHPALPAEMRSETKKWDMENYLQATISAKNADKLLNGIIKKIQPAIEAGEDAQVNVIIAGDSVFQIRTKNENDEQVTFIMIGKGLDPTTKKPSQKAYYYLSNSIDLKEYDAETGHSVAGKDFSGDLGLVIWHLVGQLIGGSNGIVHSTRQVDRAFREKLLGGSDNSSNFGGGSNNRSDVFGGGSSNNNPFGVDNVNTDQLNDMMKM